jgi:hypothetical protein
MVSLQVFQHLHGNVYRFVEQVIADQLNRHMAAMAEQTKLLPGR